MDDKTQKMLQEIYTMTQENHSYLKKIDRRQRWSTYWRVLMALIAIGSAFGVYYFLQPYFQTAVDIYNEAQSAFTSFIPGANKTPLMKK